jgi:DNA-binding Xre family transcriptional regulator
VPTAVASTLSPISVRGQLEPPGTPRDVVVTQRDASDEQLKKSIQESIRQQYLLAAEQGKISKIRAYRVFRRMDQVDLAARAGMTQPEISRAERLGQVPRMKGETLRRIARALQVRIDDLF